MAKDETSGRLLSKVAKFVRNPLKDWSELDAQDSSGSAEHGYSREMLKEMIERRQRNDFVRRREFDMLRKLRRREAAGARDGAAHPSSFQHSSADKSDERALTLKKIDEIEQQMSQQWWKGTGAAPDPATGAAGTAAAGMPVPPARAYAETAPGMAMPESVPDSGPQTANLPPVTGRVYETALEEAAILFAQGDDAGTEAILLQALSPDGPHAEHEDTWRALLDLYRATGDAEKFVAASTRYAQRLRRPGPEWVSLRALARRVQGAPTATGENAAEADWYSPPQLTREGLADLTRALGAARGPAWFLDWRSLTSIAPDAAAPLKSLFTHWADSPVQLRFAGADHLLSVLAEATPLVERDTDPAWWHLYMAVLRTLHRVDDFELVALNYCLTYELSPPAWQEPQGSYVAAEPSRVTRPGSLLPEPEGGADTGQAVLAGDLRGESHATWQRLDAELADTMAPIISCAALVRVDFAAAGTLLTWVTARDARGQRVEFVDVHRLLAAFFGVIGIADHAEVLVRRS